jgi:ATP-binding cassette subfamily C protein LapB
MTMGETPLRLAATAGTKAPRRGLADDAVRVDPLLDCLVELTRIHGRPASRAALSAGLPMGREGLTPALFARSAKRAGFATRVLRKPLDQLDRALYPVVLLLEGNRACILAGWSEDGATAELLMPEAGEGQVSMERAELEQRYSGYAISVRPQFRFDARTPQLMSLRERHWFWGAIAEQLPLYRDVLAAALLINVFALVMPLFSMNVYDRVVPNFAVDTLWMLTLGLAIIMVIDYTIRLMRGYFVDLASSRIDTKLSALIMERMLGMRLSERPPSVGAYAATLRSFETVRDFIASTTVTTLIDLPFAVLFLCVVAWISWPLVFAPIVGMLLVLGYSKIVSERMHKVSETTFRATSMRNATLVEALTALETIKAHGAERVVQTKLEATSVFLSQASGQQRLLSSSVTNGVQTLQQAVNVAMIVGGVYLIAAGQLTMGGLIACTMLGGRAMAPLSQAIALMMQYHGAKMALVSLETTMQAQRERAEESRFLHRSELSGDIVLKDVHFTYPGREQESLKGVSLRIRAGEKVVILGRVGSGKTTLQRLLLGLYAPGKGTITVDGIDLRQIDPADLRRNVGYVAQDPLLFYGSLRENITIASPYADDASVIAAAEVAGLAAFINSHPQGYAMSIGERGETLSGGQRQGVAIARAALLDPPILLLDEPTGSMDSGSESQFKERLRVFGQDKTVVIVTHRSSLLDLATRVIVLDEGQVVADGPRDDVMNELKAGRVGKAS